MPFWCHNDPCFRLQNLAQVFTVSDSSTLKVTIVETGPKVGDAWIITKGLKGWR